MNANATNATHIRSANFEDERDYAAARNIMSTLVKRKLLTEEEVKKMDKFLREQFSPVFTTFIADYPAY